jgi:Domain of unknown function (DUF4922)
MSWERILEHDAGTNEPLRQRIDALFAQQAETWPALRAGQAALQQLRTKTLDSGGEQIVVQVNPARRASTHAKTDTQSIAARPCFLCPQNMPVEERGVAFEDLIILPNPFPILPFHCTIAARAHRPQQLAGRVKMFLQLAAAMGPDLAAMYNGPRCGASAPDHFHFQAASAAGIPILNQLPPHGRQRGSHASFGRLMLYFTSPNPADALAGIQRAIEVLSDVNESDEEPMLNLLAHFKAGRYTAVLFPRRAHRPSQYFAAGNDRLAVSPAVLEMAGLLVTTDPAHFDRIDAATARSIYEQVSLDGACFNQVVAQVNT